MSRHTHTPSEDLSSEFLDAESSEELNTMMMNKLLWLTSQRRFQRTAARLGVLTEAQTQVIQTIEAGLNSSINQLNGLRDSVLQATDMCECCKPRFIAEMYSLEHTFMSAAKEAASHKQCAGCMLPASAFPQPLMVCGRCCDTEYRFCSVKCQKTAWPWHKAFCKQIHAIAQLVPMQ